MKKLLASGCCVLALQSFSQVTIGSNPAKQSDGQRLLVKAIAAIVNTNANRKAPPKHDRTLYLERPLV